MKYEEFAAIGWPSRFVVHCHDGDPEVLLREGGIGYIPPGDDPLGRGFIDATMLHASSGQRRKGRRVYYLDEIVRITDEDGNVLWSTAQ